VSDDLFKKHEDLHLLSTIEKNSRTVALLQ